MTDEKWTWVCGACGKHNDDRNLIGDESCWLKAQPCYVNSLQYGPDYRVTKARAVDEPLYTKLMQQPLQRK